MRMGIYRAKRKDNGEFVEGSLLIIGEGTEHEETYILRYMDKGETMFDMWDAYEVIQETVTGAFKT